MTKFEKSIVDFFIKYKSILFFFVITLLSILARVVLFPYISGDMRAFLLPWYKKFVAGGGLKVLKSSVGDYNLLYQTIIALIAQFKIKAKIYMFIIKGISVIFDYVLAFSVALIVKKITNKGDTFFCIVYSVLVFLPTHIINSAYWGQCDAIYVSFLILTLWYMYNGKYTASFVFYGIAFAFKLQAIFILPFILTYYFYKKSFSIFNFFITAAVIWASGTVAFLYGRDLLAPLKIYFLQTGTYKKMWLNYPSFWVLIGDFYSIFHYVAIALALTVLGIGFYYCISKPVRIDTPEKYFSVCAWFVWSCLLFLPAMHERYGFLLDALLLILSFLDVKYIKYLLVSNIIGMLTYSSFLFGIKYDVNIPTAIIFIAAYVLFTYKVFAKSGEKAVNILISEKNKV